MTATTPLEGDPQAPDVRRLVELIRPAGAVREGDPWPTVTAPRPRTVDTSAGWIDPGWF